MLSLRARRMPDARNRTADSYPDSYPAFSAPIASWYVHLLAGSPMAKADDDIDNLMAEVKKRRSGRDGYSKVAEALRSYGSTTVGPTPDAQELSLFARGKFGVAQNLRIGMFLRRALEQGVLPEPEQALPTTTSPPAQAASSSTSAGPGPEPTLGRDTEVCALASQPRPLACPAARSPGYLLDRRRAQQRGLLGRPLARPDARPAACNGSRPPARPPAGDRHWITLDT